MNRRKFIRSLSLATTVAVIPNIAIWGNKKNNKVELSRVRKTILNHCNSLLDKSGPYGSYRGGTGMRPSLYASCDVAIMRTIMGENLMVTLSDLQRQQWIDFINSFAINRGSNYGSYCDTYGHSFHHANGMVIGALGVLGGKQKYPVKLYDEFDQIEEVIPWLESLDWAKQWDASHLFWGGMHCYSMSSRCSDAWKDEVFAWLDENIDEKSGWWKKGVTHADRHQPLGGSVHILPIYPPPTANSLTGVVHALIAATQLFKHAPLTHPVRQQLTQEATDQLTGDDDTRQTPAPSEVLVIVNGIIVAGSPSPHYQLTG